MILRVFTFAFLSVGFISRLRTENITGERKEMSTFSRLHKATQSLPLANGDELY
jgi:hypothetical protein